MPISPPTVGFVSLGCPKALVDSERILTQLRAEGYVIVSDYAAADAVIVNTCGFIDAAIAESLEAIGEALDANGKVIVTGCLGKRPEFIRQTHPNILAISGPADYQAVMAAVRTALPQQPNPFVDLLPAAGIKLTPRHYAYLKIAEGCNHQCRFCIIPALRGPLVSRPIDAVLREAEQLVKAGVRELLVVAQDTAAYGVDCNYASFQWQGRDYQTRLHALCEGLGSLGVWVRLHYLYPYPHIDRILPLMAGGQILPYLDLPLQHASPRILRRMKRPGDVDRMLERIALWRRQCPDLTIRSTFIVGFPGETDEDFAALRDFLQVAQLDRVGAFAYSPVEGAAANSLPDPVPDAVTQARLDQLMQTQAAISEARLSTKVGSVQQCLIDRIADGMAIARSRADAPAIDGNVYIENGDRLRVGDWVDVKIVASDVHDLFGEVCPISHVAQQSPVRLVPQRDATVV